MRYRSAEELGELWRRVGLAEVETDHLRVETSYIGFDDLWEPFTFGVGPAGAYLATLSAGAARRGADGAVRGWANRPEASHSAPRRARCAGPFRSAKQQVRPRRVR